VHGNYFFGASGLQSNITIDTESVMCGILLHYREDAKPNNFGSEEFGSDRLFKSLVPIIRERGCDYERYELLNDTLQLYSSVLSLRQPLAKQPLIDDRFVIQFNGELYNEDITSAMNDAEFLHDRLMNLHKGDVEKTIAELVGEFAYTIYDKELQLIYFGKDTLGRKSLCYSLTSNGELYVSSCPPFDSNDRVSFEECEKAKIYTYNIAEGNLTTLAFDDSEFLPHSYKVIDDFGAGIHLTDAEAAFKIDKLHSIFTTAVQKRISTIFPLPKDMTSSKFAILFSGGIDCTLIAGFCGELCERGTCIDLLNVSFSNPRAKLSYDETPDRMLAIKSCEGLNQLYNESRGVKFNLVKINVPYDDYLATKERVIKLIYSNDTEMDLSIAIAFYFATSGVNSEGENSDCKVLLSGLGADEIFGGYTRHERIFTGISNQVKRKLKNKPEIDTNEYDLRPLNSELRDELQCDLDRLWERNLTRDDKVISCWSKEVRYPFLDETLVKWATSEAGIPLQLKLNYNPATGEITRKKALRLLAERMGLSFVANEAKRAIQFGSKSAKMDIGSGKVKGTDKL
jgi:asparagine synthetase B (glutamine-hydrolysing)